MDRRQFVKGSLMMAGGTALPANLSPVPSGENLKVNYIRQDIPAFEMPPCHGDRYEDQVPDTLDIAERCELGINCLTGITDPSADFEIYWTADFFRNPPVMMHDFNDWCQNVEGMMESLALLRLATGSDLNSHVDRVWAETLLKRFHADAFDAEGRYRFSASEKRHRSESVKKQNLGGHFHAHSVGVLCLLEYAIAAGDRELLAWCQSSFEWAKTQGNTLVGFFPEYLVPDDPTCETCEVADMIAIAVKLTRAGGLRRAEIR